MSNLANRSAWKRLLPAVRVAFGVALVFGLALFLDWRAILQAMATAEPIWWLGSAVIYVGHLGLGYWALIVLLPKVGRRERLRGMLTYGAVQAAALFTPARAAEAALPFALCSKQVTAGQVAAGLVLQRLVGLLVLFTLAVMAGSRLLGEVGWAVAGVAVVAIVATATATIACRPVRSWVGGIVETRFHVTLPGFHKHYSAILNEGKRRLAVHSIIMLLRAILNAAASYLVLLSFGVYIPFFFWVGVVAAAALAGLVPITPSGLGVSEGLVVFGLAAHGYQPEPILSTCLVSRAICVLVSSLFAFVYMALPSRRIVGMGAPTGATYASPGSAPANIGD